MSSTTLNRLDSFESFYKGNNYGADSRACEEEGTGTRKGRGKGNHTMGFKGEGNPAHLLEQLRKVVPHITVGTLDRPSKLTYTADLRARSVEKAVADKVA